MIAKPFLHASANDASVLVESFVRTSFVECATCAYEPEDQLTTKQGRCPKCHTFTWRRVPRPRSLLPESHSTPEVVYRN